MATTMKGLFDDDSSDEDESMDESSSAAVAAPPAGSSPTPSSKRVILEDDDEDDSDEGPMKPAEVGPDNKEAEVSIPKQATEGEEKTGDDETKEASVDDAGSKEAASGSDEKVAPEEVPKKTSEGDDEDDEDDVEFDDDGIVGSSAPPPAATDETAESAEAAAAAKRPTKKPRHMEVLESDRPPEGTSLYITKLPNLVGIQPEAFDPDTYSASLEEQDYRGFVHSMIRWRYAKTESGDLKRDADGKLIRESNARLVAWDDGAGGPKSYTLHVGTEVFEVDRNDSSTNGFAGLNGYLYLSQKATNADDDHSPAGTVLESMGAIQGRLTARPSSLQSEAHKKLTVAVRQKTIKKARIAEYVTQEDPEKAKQERIKVKQDLEKASARKKQSYSRRTTTPSMSRRYMEQEDDGYYDSVNIRDLKRGGEYEEMDYGEDSEDEEDEEEDTTFNRPRRPTRAGGKAGRPSRKEVEEESDDEEDELVFEEESDDDEIKATSRKKVQHKALVDDDDDD